MNWSEEKTIMLVDMSYVMKMNVIVSPYQFSNKLSNH